ncbi:MAG: LysM peptidoglycan-binding domain-containing protein [Desulfobacterales bacterium]|nr:LysM peptidoglycan-binding domain-containing protein [Desulfobacteraceae bacterium]MBT4362963.1 LysM peptidoglycan-binding domain-containing protein [Desulfobacteraceae bacterium]MBT7086876.1 LysM peptidoglycan-binding domain-containing protein [Desulfobacterales bacterium]MBT7695777.1 LysM peptidoglycan-binding domain-containing protein [Desulfobacterales bacterium]
MLYLKNLIFIISFFICFSGCTSFVDRSPHRTSGRTYDNNSSKGSVYNKDSNNQVDDLNKSLTENNEISSQKQTPDNEIQSSFDQALDFCQAAQDFWQNGESENAIQALDQAYSLIIEVDTNDIPKMIQQKEDLRFMISKRILEIYASRNIVVNGYHKAIPITINSHVQKEIDLFTKKHNKSFFKKSLKRSGKYRKKITAELKEAGLPESLLWLPLIESGFKSHALSKARALGLWQFIPSTGYKFGLKRDRYIDERLDPDKATTAAIQYLKELHQIFGDWTTVLAAYNCGEGRVLRIIRSQNVNYLDNFWDLYQRLPRETARYVPKFLATLHIINNLEKYGLDKVVLDEPLEYEKVQISKQVSLKALGAKIDVPLKTLVELNPELRYKILPQELYSLKVPKGKKDVVVAKISEVPVSSPPRPAFVYHRVRHGETLSAIARKYRTNIRNIARANNINKRNFIVAGKLLKIPQRGTVTYKPVPVRKYVKASKHVVRRGDSLWIIARNYGTTTKKIQALNNLKTTHLYIGQVLKIPGVTTKTAKTKGTQKTYIVKSGDSPYSIALKHKISLKKLLRINNLNTNSMIHPGQQLYIN